MSEQDSDDKEHDATQKKLDDARLRGEVVQSADLTAAAAYGGLILTSVAFGTAALDRFGALGSGLIGHADRLSAAFLAGESGVLTSVIAVTALPLGVFLAGPALAALIAILGQRAIVFAPDKLAVRWSRIDPVATARHKFGREGLIEFAKSLVKLIVIGGILALFLSHRIAPIVTSQTLQPAPATGLLFDLLLGFLGLVLAVTLAIGAADYLWQRHLHLRRNRMSRQELLDEFRQSDGDPHLRQARRQRAQDIASNRMMADVPRADVVIVNPTHYAVALRWNRKGRAAPVCVAKGTDTVAQRIRAAAAAAGVPIRSDPPTARALHATVDIGREIRPEHYKAVAAAIRFAERMRKRARESAPS
jgi:flagellar biosynthesis protein FlhB